MMISELSYLHLQHTEEVRMTQDLERRREQRERAFEGEWGADAAADRGNDRARSSGGAWWAGLLHPHARHAADASHGHGHAHAA